MKPSLRVASRSVRAYVGLGCEPRRPGRDAPARMELLASAEGVEVVAVSALRETEPWGPSTSPAS